MFRFNTDQPIPTIPMADLAKPTHVKHMFDNWIKNPPSFGGVRIGNLTDLRYCISPPERMAYRAALSLAFSETPKGKENEIYEVNNEPLHSEQVIHREISFKRLGMRVAFGDREERINFSVSILDIQTTPTERSTVYTTGVWIPLLLIEGVGELLTHAVANYSQYQLRRGNKADAPRLFNHVWTGR